jgi:hypothetical protein
MNENNQHDPELDPEQEARVRALLADLGTDPDAASVPPDVAARLDETLAGLVAERDETPANVVPLRRRWAPRVAAAAAAVIVVGAGGVAAANLGAFGGHSDSSNSTSSTAGSAAGGSSSKSEALDGTATPTSPSAVPGKIQAGLPRLAGASFDTDVARLLLRSRTNLDDSADSQRLAAQDDADGKTPAASCQGPSTSDGSASTPVLYDGTRAALVIHPAHDGKRLVEAWTCGGDRLLDSARIPTIHEPGLGSPSSTP